MSTQLREGADIRAWVAFLRAHAAVTRQFNQELVNEHGLTLNDYEVLLVLSRAPDRMMRRVDIANSVLLTPSGITRLLEGLERAGYVVRRACSTDARVVYAKLTDDGLEKLRTAAETHVESVRQLFGGHFDEPELEALASLLARLPGSGGDRSCDVP